MFGRIDTSRRNNGFFILHPFPRTLSITSTSWSDRIGLLQKAHRPSCRCQMLRYLPFAFKMFLRCLSQTMYSSSKYGFGSGLHALCSFISTLVSCATRTVRSMGKANTGFPLTVIQNFFLIVWSFLFRYLPCTLLPVHQKVSNNCVNMPEHTVRIRSPVLNSRILTYLLISLFWCHSFLYKKRPRNQIRGRSVLVVPNATPG